MKSTALLFMTRFLCLLVAEQERVLGVNTFIATGVKDVLTNEEYYKLDKEAEWPIRQLIKVFVLVTLRRSANFGLDN